MEFHIEKDIVEVIIRAMMFDPADFDGSDVDSDAVDNDPALFGSDAERDAVFRLDSRQNWRQYERYLYLIAWVRRKRMRTAIRVILIRSLSPSPTLPYSNYPARTFHAGRLFGWRPTY
jgi:hypothetical protein